jgi:hypothetical protein
MNNTVKKLAGDRLVKNFVADEIMAPVAGVIARFLTMLPSDAARKFLEAPKRFLGLNIPSEFTSRFGAGLGGLGVAELIRLVDPGFDEDNLDYVQDLIMYVAEKYNDLAGAQGSAVMTSTLSPLRGAERIPMVIIVRGQHIYHHEDCPVVERTRRVPNQGGQQGGARQQQQEVPRTDLRSMSLEHVQAMPSMSKAACCSGLFAVDERNKQKAEAAAPKPKQAAPKPPSFAKIHGEALTSTDADLRRMAKRLQGIIATKRNGLTPEEYVLLECCDSMDEYKALAACTTIAELRSLLPTLRARDERNFLGQGAQEVGFAAAKVWKFAEGVKQRSDTAAAEYKRQRDVLAFCQKQKPCVKREEILAITPGRNSLAELTMDDVRNALIVNRRSGLSPLARHRTQQQPTQPQPAGAANVGRPGWVRRLVRFFV